MISSVPKTPCSPLGRLLRLAWQYRSACLQVLALQVVLLGLVLSEISLTGLCVDVLRRALVPTAPKPTWPGGFEPPMHWSAEICLLVIGGLVLFIGAVRARATYAHGIQSGRVQHLSLVPSLRAKAFHKLQRLSATFYDQNGSASIINRVTSDVQATRSFVEGVMLQGAVLLLTLVVYAVFMLRSHVGLALACLATVSIAWIHTRRFGTWARSAYGDARDLIDSMVLTMSEGIHGIEVTKVFGREHQELARFKERNRAVVEQQEDIFRRFGKYAAGVEFTSHVSVAVALSYGGMLVSRGAMTLGGLIAFLSVLIQFTSQVCAMARVANTLQQSLAGARRVFEMLDAPIDIASPAPTVAIGGRSQVRLQGALRFESVHFAYPNGHCAISDVSFEVPAGTSLAILGPTGSGKTTLLSLVPRFYEVSAGRVSIDGEDVRRFDVDALRRNLGVVSQEAILFKQSVAENIAFAAPGASRAAVERAARIAYAHDFIMKLPGGYDAPLEEEGANLSRGQRQRLALARAVFVEPPVMILDDPTTALDPRTETQVLRAMRRIMQGRTTLMTTSRLSALRFADRIIVLENGKIIEQGNHLELMARRGLYHRTAQLQGFDYDGSCTTARAGHWT